MSSLPFLPFSKPTIDEATIAAVGDVLRSGWITSGPKVQAFEAQLSEYFGGRPVRTFNSGTCTMEIALRIAGIGAGDEVITTPISWVATANVIMHCGATPVFVDICDDFDISVEAIRKAITPAAAGCNGSPAAASASPWRRSTTTRCACRPASTALPTAS